MSNIENKLSEHLAHFLMCEEFKMKNVKNFNKQKLLAVFLNNIIDYNSFFSMGSRKLYFALIYVD